MEKRKVDELNFKPALEKSFDVCQYCRNIDKCINQHWKRCKPWIDQKHLKLRIPLSYR